MANGDVFITRTFDAPRDLVWKTWTEPDRVKMWWGPKDFSCPDAKSELRQGGEYRYAMKDPSGKITWGGGTFKEFKPPEKIVATDAFYDEKGENKVPPSYYDMKDTPEEMEVTIQFEEQGDKTKMTLRHKEFFSDEMVRLCTQGWNESIDKFERLLETFNEKNLNR